MHGSIMTALAWAAQTAPAADPASGEPAANPGMFPPELMYMLAIMGVLFYFLILKPQRTDQRKREQMIEELGKGDAVVTAGGIHGTVEGVDKGTNTVMVAVAPKVTLRVSRTSISNVVSKKNKPKGEKDDKSEATAV